MKNISKIISQMNSSILLWLFFITTVAIGVYVSAILLASPAHAQTQAEKEICLGAGGTYDDTAGTCNPAAGQKNLFGTGGLFEGITNTLIFIVGAISVVMLIIGGIRFVVSAGDANAVTAARNTILYAVVGIIVAILAFAVVNFVIGRL